MPDSYAALDEENRRARAARIEQRARDAAYELAAGAAEVPAMTPRESRALAAAVAALAAQAGELLAALAAEEKAARLAPEAAAGMMRCARPPGPGTPACGGAERQALVMLRGKQG